MPAGDAVTVSNRERISWGSLMAETGKFSDEGDHGAGGTIYTKLGRLLWVRLMATGTNTDGAFSLYINSNSESTTEDDPGSVTFADELTDGDYIYLAIGRGN